jgi:hypothetical protein
MCSGSQICLHSQQKTGCVECLREKIAKYWIKKQTYKN